MTTRRLVTLLVVAACATQGAAQAQTLTALTKDDFTILVEVQSGSDWVNLTTADSQTYFNAARCACASPVRLTAQLTQTGIAKRSMITSGNIQMIVGTDCLNRSLANRDQLCQTLASAQLTSFASQGLSGVTTVNMVITPNTGACTPKEATQTVWLLVDGNADSVPDLTDTAAPSFALPIDTQAPPTPVVTSVQGGNEALVATWDGIADVTDLAGFQILCSRDGETPVFASGAFSAHYSTMATECGAQAATLPPDAAPSVAGGVLAASAPAVAYPAFGSLARLDPLFICSRLQSATATSARIAILQNAIPYLVGVVAIDKSGNPSPLTAVYLQSPLPSNDFWKGYRSADGTASGGFCAFGAGAPSGLATATLVAALALASARARRRRRP